MKQKLMTVKDYYQNVDFQPVFDVMGKDAFKFRQIRILCEDNKWIKVRDQIKNAEDLKKNILRLIQKGHSIIKIYYSVARWLQPHSVGSKSHQSYKYSPCFLRQDRLVVDLDRNPIKNCRKLLKFCKEKNYEVEYIIFSGSRGLHISIKRELSCNIADPNGREEWYKMKNFLFIKELEDYGIELDNCIKNTRQIVKVPLTLSDSNVCYLLGTEKEEVSLLLSKNRGVPRGSSSEIPIHGLVRVKPMKEIFQSINKRRVERPRLSSPATFILNRINGIKDRFILVLKYHDLEIAEKDCKRLLSPYTLSDLYLFSSSESIQVVCLKAFKMRRLLKILRKSKSINKNHLFTYGCLYLEPIDEYIKTIFSDIEINRRTFVSRSHYLLFKKYIPMFNYPKLCGNKFLTITKMVSE